MIRKAFIGLILLITCGTSHAQRISTGFHMGTTAYFHTELPDNYVFPPHSYFTYYTFNEKKDYLPVFSQKLNGISAGLNLSVDYKRWMLTSEFTFSTNKIKLDLLFPSPLGNLLDDSWSTFVVQKYSYNFPLVLSFKPTRKANGLFLSVGAQYSFNSFDETNDGLDSEISDAIYIFIAETEMYNVLYNEHNYFSGIAGLGFRKGYNSYAFRFVQRMGGAPENYPLAKYWQIDFQFTKQLNFQKLKKGYHLYLD